MKFAKLAVLATAIAATPIAANAQDVGTTIYSQVDDSVVGTIESNDGTTVVIDTGDYKAPLPGNYLAERPVGEAGATGWTINATKAMIDAMMQAQVDEANAKRDEALVVGASVVTAQGLPAGTVYTIDEEDTVILERDTGIITLKREHFAVNDQGALMALFTIDQINANTVEVPEGAEILTPAQAAAKEAGGEATASVEAEAGADATS